MVLLIEVGGYKDFINKYSGVYGHEDYEIMEPLVAIHLPSVPVLLRESLYQCLPERLQAVLNVGMVLIIAANVTLNVF